jgi:ribosome-binding factor A
MDAARARKLGGRIAQIVAEMLERRIKDPRLGFVTVTEARLTNDLREATVFYTVYGSAEEHAATAAALASAVGVIRSEVGRQTGLRHTPSLEFRLDTVPDNARNIEELVARAREADAALAAVREGAEPAGDADPYRVPAATDDDSDGDDSDGDDSDGDDSDGDDSDGDDSDGDDSDGDDSEAGRGKSAALADPSAGLGYSPAAALRGEDDHLAETPAPGERGAGYSRS